MKSIFLTRFQKNAFQIILFISCSDMSPLQNLHWRFQDLNEWYFCDWNTFGLPSKSFNIYALVRNVNGALFFSYSSANYAEFSHFLEICSMLLNHLLWKLCAVIPKNVGQLKLNVAQTKWFAIILFAVSNVNRVSFGIYSSHISIFGLFS